MTKSGGNPLLIIWFALTMSVVLYGVIALVMAPVGYVLAPSALDFVNAAPAVKAEALPYYERLLSEFEKSEYLSAAQKRVTELKGS